MARLRDERDANARLRGETGIMRKKFTSLQNEIDVHKEDIKKLQGENGKLNNVIKNLEKDIAGLKKEIQERDETIQVQRHDYSLRGVVDNTTNTEGNGGLVDGYMFTRIWPVSDTVERWFWPLTHYHVSFVINLESPDDLMMSKTFLL